MEVNDKPKPTPMDWMRLATFIDGEGCICLGRQNNAGTKFRDQHYLELHIGNCDPRLASWCKTTFGVGNTFMRKWNNQKNLNHRHVYCWMATGRKAIALLKECLPYFLLKREQAEVAIAFGDLLTYGGQNVVSSENFKQRDILKQRMYDLKRVQHESAERVN